MSSFLINGCNSKKIGALINLFINYNTFLGLLWNYNINQVKSKWLWKLDV